MSQNVPDNNDYFKILLLIIQKQVPQIYNLIKDGHIVIEVYWGQFSRKRWNMSSGIIHFYLDFDKIEPFNIWLKKKEYRVGQKLLENNMNLINICDDLIEKTYEFDIIGIDVSPTITKIDTSKDMIKEVERFVDTLPDELIEKILPAELIERGKKMAEVYFLLNCIENSLRNFIEIIAKEQYGEAYFTSLKISKKILENIANRKTEESKHKWLRMRGDSDLYYCDFGDLSSIFNGNPDLFKDHLPDPSWINDKLKDIEKIRNKVAHNSYVEDDEREMLRVYYKNILKQISGKFMSKSK